MTAAKRQQALASRRKPEVGSWATAIALQCLIRPSPGIGATCRASKQRFEKLRAADRGFETMSLLRSSVGRKHGLLWPTARTLGLTPPGYGLPPHSRLRTRSGQPRRRHSQNESAAVALHYPSTGASHER